MSSVKKRLFNTKGVIVTTFFLWKEMNCLFLSDSKRKVDSQFERVFAIDYKYMVYRS